jgi:predicted dehydrogenase
MPRVLIVGAGAAGTRHAQVFGDLSADVGIVSRRYDGPLPRFGALADALSSFRPDGVVVSNETNLHLETVGALAELGFAGWVLVEKPVFHRVCESIGTEFPIWVAYNMRFLPAVRRARELLGDRRLLAASFSVGQYLPDWRPGTDYRSSYSARRELGGGALRDLSHEIDLALWFGGPASFVTGASSNSGTLEVDCEDRAAVIIRHASGVISSVTMNLLDRPAHRRAVLTTDRGTITVDLLTGELVVDGVAESVSDSRGESYRRQAAAILRGETSGLCTVDEALGVLKVIELVEAEGRNGV